MVEHQNGEDVFRPGGPQSSDEDGDADEGDLSENSESEEQSEDGESVVDFEYERPRRGVKRKASSSWTPASRAPKMIKMSRAARERQNARQERRQARQAGREFRKK